MAHGSVADRVAALVKEPIESLGLKLWDVKYVKEGASWYLRVFIDKDGGVDIYNCTDVSHLVDPILDEADIIGTSYYFEVCSPGLERELVKPEHFEAFIGAKVRVVLFKAIDGSKEIVGNLVSFGDELVIATDADEIKINKQDIAKVKLADI
ncbi:MAG: ribosome maturation factor RimP [Clostridia bacterium]|nr:ribosome maturation factor RimP [Clostridia bacterium]